MGADLKKNDTFSPGAMLVMALAAVVKAGSFFWPSLLAGLAVAAAPPRAYWSPR